METLYDNNGLQISRFSCDCLSSGHSLTMSIEKDEEGRVLLCNVEIFLTGKPSFSWRLKQAWLCLRGKDGSLGEVIIREEDYPELFQIASKLLTNTNTFSFSSNFTGTNAATK